MDEQTSRDHPIREDMRFQRRTWAVERVSWGLLALLVGAGLAGLFAHGPLSKAKAESGGALAVEYQRFQRVTRLTDFTFRLGGAAEPVLTLNRAFQDAYEIASVEPRPEKSTGTRDGVTLTFTRPDAGELTIVLFAHPRRWGRLGVQAQAGGSGPVPMPILVYP